MFTPFGFVIYNNIDLNMHNWVLFNFIACSKIWSVVIEHS